VDDVATSRLQSTSGITGDCRVTSFLATSAYSGDCEAAHAAVATPRHRSDPSCNREIF
jgi:hypothetical protein